MGRSLRYTQRSAEYMSVDNDERYNNMRTKILEELDHRQVERVSVTADGSGDEGQIDAIEARGHDGEAVELDWWGRVLMTGPWLRMHLAEFENHSEEFERSLHLSQASAEAALIAMILADHGDEIA